MGHTRGPAPVAAASLLPSLLLDQSDLPQMSLVESIIGGADADDEDFGRCGGHAAGFQVWHASAGADLMRHVDIRWLFGSVAGARRYHRLQIARNAEGLPPLAGDCLIGEGGRTFGGQAPLAAALGVDLPMAICLFTVGPVVAKCFVSGVPQTELGVIAHKAEARIRTALDCTPLHFEAVESAGAVSERWPKGEWAYEGILAEQPLLAGQGIGNILTFDHTIADMYQAIGGGEEQMGRPFVYTFAKGWYVVVVTGQFRTTDGQFEIVSLRYVDDPFGTLRTPQGLTVGSRAAAVRSALGEPTRIDGGWWRYRSGIAFALDDHEVVTAIELVPLW